MELTSKDFDKWLLAAPWPAMSTNKFPGTKFKYPYKHFLLLSIIEAYNGIPFNKKVDFRLISKNFYDLLTSDSMIVNAFSKSKAKGDWVPGIWTPQLEKSVISLIKRMPAKMLDTYFKKHDTPLYELRNNDIYFRNYTGMRDAELSKLIKDETLIRLKRCIPHNPSYNDEMSIKMLMNTKQYMSWLLEEIKNSKIDVKDKGRDHQLQSLWRKALIDTRGCKCQICDKPYTADNLQAAHIKKQSECKTNKEKFDLKNGMMMCWNHHGFYDNGYWSVKDGKTVACSKITDPFSIGVNHEPDLNGKQITSDKEMLSYFKWHYDNIYKCKEKH